MIVYTCYLFIVNSLIQRDKMSGWTTLDVDPRDLKVVEKQPAHNRNFFFNDATKDFKLLSNLLEKSRGYLEKKLEQFFRKVNHEGNGDGEKSGEGEGSGLMDGENSDNVFRYRDYEVVPEGMQSFIEKYFVKDSRSEKTSPLFMAQYLLEHGGILEYRDAPIYITSAKLLALAVVFE